MMQPDFLGTAQLTPSVQPRLRPARHVQRPAAGVFLLQLIPLVPEGVILFDDLANLLIVGLGDFAGIQNPQLPQLFPHT